MIIKTACDKDLEFEKTLSEYKRVKIVCYLLSAGLVIGIINNYFDLFGLQKFFKFKTSGYATLLWLLFYLIYEIIFLFLLKRHIKAGISLREGFRLIHTLVEIIFPGILMFMLTIIEQRAVYLDAPYFLVFFLLIAISALQLSFKISITLGVIAALEYAALTY